MVLRLIEKDFKANSDLAPKTIAEAVNDGLPITVVSKVSGMDSVCAQIEFDLIKCLALLNLNLTIKEHQYPYIVQELVDTFPNESIQDFQLCFKNGVKGKYGKIYNVDLAVLAGWMGEYLDEKYAYIERQNEKVQSEEKEAQADVLSELIERTTQTLPEDQKPEKDNSATLRDRVIGRLSEAEIKLEGQERPHKPKYVPPDASYLEMMEKKREWGRLFHDLYTGNKTNDWIPFEEWIKGRQL